MTLQEKVSQLYSIWPVLEEDGSGQILYIQGEDVPEDLDDLIAYGLGQICRPLGAHKIDVKKGVWALNALQRKVIAKSRFGIPVLAHEECLPGLMAKGATLSPSALNYGSTWQPELLEKVGAAIGAEL